MSAQPLNTSISVFRNVRAYRKNLRHEAIAALTKRLRPLILSVPGREVLVGVLSRDQNFGDLSPFCGQPRYNPTSVPGVTITEELSAGYISTSPGTISGQETGSTTAVIGASSTMNAYLNIRGFPIVVGVLPELSFADAVNQLADNQAPIDMPFTIGGDRFIQNAPAQVLSSTNQSPATTLSVAGAADDLFSDLTAALTQVGDIEGVIVGSNIPGQAAAPASATNPLAADAVSTTNIGPNMQGVLVTGAVPGGVAANF